MHRLIVMLMILASEVLTSCGGNSTPSSNPTPPATQYYLPLALGNMWNYDCGNGVSIMDTVTQTVTISGTQTFALQLQFPNAATETYLVANDQKGNTAFYGYLVNGTPQSVAPTAYIAASPTPNQSFNFPAPDGSTVNRIFVVNENTNPTPLGVFQVASYNDNGKQDIWGYALGKGIMEQDHGSFDCKIQSYTLH